MDGVSSGLRPTVAHQLAGSIILVSEVKKLFGNHMKEELGPEMVKNIERALEDVKKGRTYSTSEVRKKLRIKIFIAGPLFSQAEREFNLKVDRFLKKHGFETFLSQRDVGLLWEHVRKRGRRAYRAIYKGDLRGLEGADAVVAILDGPDVDSGTAFEVGYACAKGKPVIGLKTDMRVFARGEVVNNMLAQGVKKIVKNFDDLIPTLNAIKKTKRGQPGER